MQKRVVCSYWVAGILGAIAAATGFAGEATKVKASEVNIVNDKCVYPSSYARELAMVSILFIIITRFYISVSFGGAGYRKHDHTISKLLFVLSWVTSVVAVALLVAAAGSNNKEGRVVDSSGNITCYVAKPGIFAGGASLALLSVVYSFGAYITSTPPPQSTMKPTVAYPVGSNVDLEKNKVPLPPQQYPPQ